MKRCLLFVLIILSSLSMSTVSAEIITRNHYQKGIEKISQRSSPYNDQFIINSTFKGKYIAWVNQDGQKGISTDPYIYLEIFLKPTGEGKPDEMQITSDKFVYQIEGEANPKYGAFSEQSDGMGRTKGTGEYSIYGNNESGYGVQQHYTQWYMGPIFRLENPYPQQILQKKLAISFSADLFQSIKAGTEITIQIPYANNKHNITEQKYITFMITKETLAEWKEVSGF